MSDLPGLLLDLAPGLLIGSALGLLWVNRSLARIAKLGLRREWVLLLLVSAYDQGSANGHSSAVPMAHALLASELRRQQRVRRWTKVPDVGEPWPGQRNLLLEEPGAD